MARPAEQPDMGSMSATGVSKTTWSTMQGDTGGMSAARISKVGNEENQHRPIVQGCERAHAQS
jgi:hypothetical protein